MTLCSESLTRAQIVKLSDPSRFNSHVVDEQLIVQVCLAFCPNFKIFVPGHPGRKAPTCHSWTCYREDLLDCIGDSEDESGLHWYMSRQRSRNRFESLSKPPFTKCVRLDAHLLSRVQWGTVHVADISWLMGPSNYVCGQPKSTHHKPILDGFLLYVQVHTLLVHSTPLPLLRHDKITFLPSSIRSSPATPNQLGLRILTMASSKYESSSSSLDENKRQR